MFFSAFFNEIDASNESLLSFGKHSLELLCLPDVLEEFRTICFYEQVNLSYI